MDIGLIVAFIALGSIVGFLAGLLGIGGGLVMVPVLTSLFIWQGLPQDQVVHLALGTSMASIVITSISSMRAHHKKGGVLWPVVRLIAPGIVAGAFLATFLDHHLPAALPDQFLSAGDERGLRLLRDLRHHRCHHLGWSGRLDAHPGLQGV